MIRFVSRTRRSPAGHPSLSFASRLAEAAGRNLFSRKIAPLFTLLLFLVSPTLTLAWTDDPLNAGTTRIRRVHITELRSAIDAKRSNFVMSAGAYQDTSLTEGTSQIRAAHITDLRTAINQLRTNYNDDCPAVVPAAGSFTDATLTAGSSQIRAIHLTELRQAVDGIGTCASCCPLNACRTGTCIGTGCGVLGVNSEGNEQGGPACPMCQDCNATGGCINVLSGTNDNGCNSSGSCYTAAQTCNGSGGCNTNFRPNLDEGSSPPCATCQDCNGAGACTNVGSGVGDVGCNSSGSCYTAAQTCNGSGGCNTNFRPNLDEGSSPACATCQDCDGAGACTNVGSGVGDVGCNSSGSCYTAAQTCNGSGGCNTNFRPNLDEGSSPACATCQDCDGAGACTNVGSGVGDVGCNSSGSCYTAAQTCNGSGGCNTNFRPNLDEGSSPACATCQDCNGAGTCTNVGSGVGDVGCNSSGSCYTAAQTCNGSGGCNTNFRPNLDEGSSPACATCQDCDGAGACTNVGSGVGDVGCNSSGSCYTAAQTCNGSGGCNTNFRPNLDEGSSPACATCQDCDGAGACTNVGSGVGDVGCNSSGSCYMAAQTCNGSGGCNTNFRPNLDEGSSPACATCQDCNGAGACTNVGSGIGDVGCNSSGSCYTASQTCNGSGGCNTNYSGVGTEGSPTCPVCKDCDGAGNCANVTTGAEDNGCLFSSSQCCDGSGVCISRPNCYRDLDGDGYGAGAVNPMCGGCTAGWVTNNTDCYDVNTTGGFNTHPGQTTYFAVQRGDGSFDYNCINGAEKEFSSYSDCVTFGSGNCAGDCVNNSESDCRNTNPETPNCGETYGDSVSGCVGQDYCDPGCGAAYIYTGTCVATFVEDKTLRCR